MTIENNLASIAKSLEIIATALSVPSEAPAMTIPAPVQQFQPQPAPVQQYQPQPVPAPVPQYQPQPAPAPAPVQQYQPQPAPVPNPYAPAPTGAPFTDGKGLMEYCMNKYKVLGPVKGGLIQQVLTELGCVNLATLQPAQYATFFAKVEAIQ